MKFKTNSPSIFFIYKSQFVIHSYINVEKKNEFLKISVNIHFEAVSRLKPLLEDNKIVIVWYTLISHM